MTSLSTKLVAPAETPHPSTAQLVAEIATDIKAMTSPTMDNVIGAVAVRLGIMPAVIGARMRNPNVTRARAIAMAVGVAALGLRHREIAAYFGMRRDSVTYTLRHAGIAPSRKGTNTPRSRTLDQAALRLRVISDADDEPYPNDVQRPVTRADCKSMPRPCPFVSCKHHLFLDVNPETGALKLNHPNLEVWEMTESCSLDVADRGGITLKETGEILNLTRERIRQIEERGLRAVKAAAGPELAAPSGGRPEAHRLHLPVGWGGR